MLGAACDSDGLPPAGRVGPSPSAPGWGQNYAASSSLPPRRRGRALTSQAVVALNLGAVRLLPLLGGQAMPGDQRAALRSRRLRLSVAGQRLQSFQLQQGSVVLADGFAELLLLVAAVPLRLEFHRPLELGLQFRSRGATGPATPSARPQHQGGPAGLRATLLVRAALLHPRLH